MHRPAWNLPVLSLVLSLVACAGDGSSPRTVECTDGETNCVAETDGPADTEETGDTQDTDDTQDSDDPADAPKLGDTRQSDHLGTLTYIPAGTFEQGCVEGRDDVSGGCYDDEHPHHTVTLSRGFWMMETELTQAAWLSLHPGANPAAFSDCGLDCPVEQVSWWDALTLANQVSRRELGETAACYHLEGCTGTLGSDLVCTDLSFNVACTGYRLPTEAEWEYAARGGQAYAYAGAARVTDAGWFVDNAKGTTHPVREKAENGFGLFDMTGNVHEWTWDWKGDYEGRAVTDPTGPATGSQRVIRGGRYAGGGQVTRIANRASRDMTDRTDDVGIRFVRTVR